MKDYQLEFLGEDGKAVGTSSDRAETLREAVSNTLHRWMADDEPFKSAASLTIKVKEEEAKDVKAKSAEKETKAPAKPPLSYGAGKKDT